MCEGAFSGGGSYHRGALSGGGLKPRGAFRGDESGHSGAFGGVGNWGKSTEGAVSRIDEPIGPPWCKNKARERGYRT